MSRQLPDFPWDSLVPAKEKASSHPDGIVDLSVGAPVDPTPQIIQDALCSAADAHTYPQVWGTAALRESIRHWIRSTWDGICLPDEGIMPVVGTKELVGWLPTLLGLTSADTVVVPVCAYPTYEVGALMVGAQVRRCDDPAELPASGPGVPALVWINSPANPHGSILSADQLRAWISYARRVGAILASDECYLDFSYEAEPVSTLREDVCGGTADRILAVHSLSKRSNLAGYRAGFVAGDEAVVTELIGLRKHLGMMVPAPVQAAMIAALGDHRHVAEQRERYRRRRQTMKTALEQAGFRIDHSQGSLYLWATLDEDCRVTTDRLAQLGILVAPGDFYGDAGARHVRISMTASDERIDAAAARLLDAGRLAD